jgi:hypothetical protein
MRYRLIGPGGSKQIAIRVFAVVTFAFALLLHTAATVKAQPVCMPHDDFRIELHRNFSEAPVAIAIANNGALIELYAKRDKSSWTLVMTRPGGLSCVLVAGEEWNDLRKREEARIAQLDSLADWRGR